MQGQAYTERFIEMLQLGETQDLFLNALKQTSYPSSLIEPESQKTLSALFEPLFTKDQTKKHNVLIDRNTIITDTHFDDICKNYKAFIDDKDPQQAQLKQAALLFCLSMMFTRYSSTQFFGTPEDSPIALRQYAISLLNKAKEIEPALFEFLEQEAQKSRALHVHQLPQAPAVAANNAALQNLPVGVFDDYLNRMVGKGESLTCTYIASEILLSAAKKLAEKFPNFQKMFRLIYPNAWL